MSKLPYESEHVHNLGHTMWAVTGIFIKSFVNIPGIMYTYK